MKQVIIIVCCIWLIACNVRHKPRLVQKPVMAPPAFYQQDAPGHPENDSAWHYLSHYLAQFQTPESRYTFTGSDTTIIGNHGTLVSMARGDLEHEDGTEVSGPVVICLIELTGKGAMMRNHAPTVSNGRLLTSGGACYLHCSAAGKPLRIRKGHAVKVGMKHQGAGMSLFYGARDTNGIMNWEPDGQEFTDASCDSTEIKYKVGLFLDSIVYENHKQRHIFYADSYVHTEQGRVTVLTPFTYDSVEVFRSIPVFSSMVANTRQIISIRHFGWINCDRFMTYANKANIHTRMEPSSGQHTATIFFVLKNEKSVTEQVIVFDSNGNGSDYMGLPEGFEVTMVAFSWDQGKPLLYSETLRLGSENQLDLKFHPATQKEILNLLGMEDAAAGSS